MWWVGLVGALAAGLGGSGGASAAAAGWSAQVITGPPRANGQLVAVSCGSASACVAVGSFVNSQEVQSPLVEHWNGRGWEVDDAPSLPFGTAGSLDTVSCYSTNACIAVGTYTSAGGDSAMLAERWNGRAWSIEPAPTPAAAAGLALGGVSCPSLRVCVAVGSFSGSGHRPRALLEQWDGSSWSLEQIPSPSRDRAMSLSGVSCSSPTACMAVGAAGQNTTDTPLAERWDGERWSIEKTPRLRQPGGLSGVACVSNTGCFAVGSVTSVAIPGQSYATTSTLAERWIDGKWSIQRTPNPHLSGGGGSPQVVVKLAAISCSSLRACTAVGSSDLLDWGDDNLNDYSEMLVERWNGRRWASQHAPKPAATPAAQLDERPAFSGVSCGSPTTCIAVGPVSNVLDPSSTNTSVQTTLAERWNGDVWQIQDTVNGVGSSGGKLQAVSCPTATTCFAVGWGSQYGGPGLVERWSGVGWTVTPTPAVGADSAELNGISCTSARDCTAVGAGSGGGFIERWNGSAWTIETIPGPSASSVRTLSSVSCPSATFCVAVGNTPAAGARPVAAIWNGTKWTVQDTSPSGYLDAVSCTSPTFCLGVGASDNQALAESWDGSTWTVQRTPIPAGATGAQLSGVSCASSAACTAVGSFGEGGGQGLTLVERWSGSAWTIQSSPNAPGVGSNGFSSSLLSVSCTTATSCTAAGESRATTTTPTSLAESWNGTTWTIQRTPNQGPLQGVSCSEAGACTAVGFRGGYKLPNPLPTALRYG